MSVTTIDILPEIHPAWEKDYPNQLDEQAHVWKVNIQLFDSNDLVYFRTLLSVDEEIRASKYRRQEDCKRYIVGRAILKSLLAEYIGIFPADIRIKTEGGGKPFIDYPAEKGIHFNLSHSQNLILISISRLKTGIDVEYIDPYFEFRDILANSFSSVEATFVQQDQQPTLSFFRLWTRKEALLKAVGTGISESIKQVPSLIGCYGTGSVGGLNDVCWTVMGFRADKDYTASLAVRKDIKEIKFFEPNLTIDLVKGINTKDLTPHLIE